MKDKFDFDAFVKRTVVWRILNSICLILISTSIMFISHDISENGKVMQANFQALEQKIDVCRYAK